MLISTICLQPWKTAPFLSLCCRHEYLLAMAGCKQWAKSNGFWRSLKTMQFHQECPACFSGVLGRSLKINECPAARRLLSAGGSRCHALQHVFIIGGSGTGYDGMAQPLTDGILRHPSGCLLTRHARYSRDCHPCLPLAPSARPTSGPSPCPHRPSLSLLPPRASPQRWLCEWCHIDYSRVFFFLKLCFPVSWM